MELSGIRKKLPWSRLLGGCLLTLRESTAGTVLGTGNQTNRKRKREHAQRPFSISVTGSKVPFAEHVTGVGHHRTWGREKNVVMNGPLHFIGVLLSSLDDIDVWPQARRFQNWILTSFDLTRFLVQAFLPASRSLPLKAHLSCSLWVGIFRKASYSSLQPLRASVKLLLLP